MSKSNTYLPEGLVVRYKGPGQADPILTTITPDDFVRLKMLANQEAARERAEAAEPEAATPEPWDIDAETEKFRVMYEEALSHGVTLGSQFKVAFARYLRYLESRLKPTPVEPDVVVTREDLLVVNELARRILDADPDHRKEAAMIKALQEWTDHKRQSRPILFIPSGVTATITDADPFMTFSGTPEEEELTDAEIMEGYWAYDEARVAGRNGLVCATAFRRRAAQFRLLAKSSAEPDPGEDAQPQPIEPVNASESILESIARIFDTGTPGDMVIHEAAKTQNRNAIRRYSGSMTKTSPLSISVDDKIAAKAVDLMAYLERGDVDAAITTRAFTLAKWIGRDIARRRAAVEAIERGNEVADGN